VFGLAVQPAQVQITKAHRNVSSPAEPSKLIFSGLGDAAAAGGPSTTIAAAMVSLDKRIG
jgi:hypothetical protein